MHPLSSAILKNANVNDTIIKFAMKGRLQLLETNSNMNKYYPQTFPRSCNLCNHPYDTNSHALNGCQMFKGLYTERHDRIVIYIYELAKCNLQNDNCHVNNKCFPVTNNIPSKPDICILDDKNKLAFIVEISVPFDKFIEICYNETFLKYLL